MSVYLDHAATSLPRRRAATEAAAAAQNLANPSRGLHTAQAEATRVLETARAAVRALVGYGTVCFTPGCTYALSQAILGIRPKPRAVAVDPLSHNAIRRAALRLGVPLWVLPHDAGGRIDVDRVRGEWEPVDLLVVAHASNVTGRLQPVRELVEVARARGARVIVDAAQTAGIVPLDLGEPSALAFSAHKGLAALAGTGALVLADGVDLEPLVVGGTGFDSLSPEMPAELPARLEVGTMNLPGIAAMGAAAREALDRPWDYEPITARLQEAVAQAGVRAVGSGELPIVSFNVDGTSPTEVEEMLDRSFDIVVRAGLHCAPSAHEALGSLPTGTVRASAGAATIADEVSALREALVAISRNTRS